MLDFTGFITASSIHLNSLFISSIVTFINSASSSFLSFPCNKTILFCFAIFNNFLILPNDESCSISVYEALNAGCFPVVYDVGAVREQLNGNGIIYKTERPKDQEILTALKYSGDRTEFIVQGTRFDRKNNLDVIAKRLEEIKVQL